MSFREVCATLAGPPWLLSRAEILDLDRPWVQEVIFARRDERGAVVVEEPRSPSPADEMRRLLRLRGWPEWRALAELSGETP